MPGISSGQNSVSKHPSKINQVSVRNTLETAMNMLETGHGSIGLGITRFMIAILPGQTK